MVQGILTAVLCLSASPVLAAFGRPEADSLLWFAVVAALMLLVGILWWQRARDCRSAGELLQIQRELDRVVAERDQVDQELLSRDVMLRHLFDLAGVGIFRSTLAGDRFLVANRALARMYGYESLELFLCEVRPVDIYDSLDQRLEMLRMLELNGHLDRYEIGFSRKDGFRGVVLVSAYFDRAEGWLDGSVLDITELRSADRELARQHAFLQTLLNAIPNPVFYKDRDGCYQLLNEAFLRMMGQPADQLLGKSVYDIAPRELADIYYEMDAVLLQAGGQATQKYDAQVQTGAGRRNVVFFKESLLDEAGRIQGLVGTVSDVTAMLRQERELRLVTVRYRNILDNAVEGIVELAPDGRLLDGNPALAGMLGCASVQELLRSAEGHESIFADGEELRAIIEEVRRAGRIRQGVVPVQRRDGATAWLSLSLCGVFDDHGELERMHGLVLDVTAQKAEHEELSRKAQTDALTGLPNRETLLSDLDRMIRQAGESGQCVGVLFLDLDGFKAINDRWGHQAGDEILVQVGKRIRQRLRRHDVLARMGGDEFAILLSDIGNADNLRTVVSAILWDMHNPFECCGERCTLGVSVGASLFPDHGVVSADLLAAADLAMYAVKRQGRNGLCVSGSEPDWFDVVERM